MKKYQTIFILFLLLIVPNFVLARSGCCSHHGGVMSNGCGCNDGTALSSTCAPYYSCESSSNNNVTYNNYTQFPKRPDMTQVELSKKLYDLRCQASTDCVSNYSGPELIGYGKKSSAGYVKTTINDVCQTIPGIFVHSNTCVSYTDYCQMYFGENVTSVSYGYSSFCECKKGYQPDNITGVCSPSLCPAGLILSNGKCTCDSNLILENGKCVSKESISAREYCQSHYGKDSIVGGSEHGCGCKKEYSMKGRYGDYSCVKDFIPRIKGLFGF